MEFKFRAIDEQASTYLPPTSSISFFSEQAFRAGYSGPDFSRTAGFFGNPHPSNMREAGFFQNSSNMGEAGFFQNSSNMREAAMQREFEKEKIREEIIASEIARRRMLEAEVRREMFLERQMALTRAEGLSLFPGASPATMLFEPRMPVLHQSEGRSFEERLAFSIEERLGNRARGGIGGFQTLPFQSNSEPRISEVKPPSEVNKDKVIFLAKPEGSLSGEKRKAVTPPAAGATPTPVSFNSLSGEKRKAVTLPAAGPIPASLKKPKEEWSCAICQVTATSERGLNEHLQGKKHKSREAGLRALKTGKNYAIGLFPKNTGKPIKLAEITENQNSEQEKLEAESEHVTKSKDKWLKKKPIAEDEEKNKDSALQVVQGSGKSNKKKCDLAQKMQKTEEHKKKFKFWCERCQVGAFSEKVMDAHMKGKRHVWVLQELHRKGGSVPVAQGKGGPRTGEESEVVAKDERVTLAFVKEPGVVAKDEKEVTPRNNAGSAGGEAQQNHGASEDAASSGPH